LFALSARKALNTSAWLTRLVGCLLVCFFAITDVNADVLVSHAGITQLQTRNLVDSNETLPAIAKAVKALKSSDPPDIQLRLLILFGNNLIDNGFLKIAESFLPAAIELARIQNQPIASAHLKILQIATISETINTDIAITNSIRDLLTAIRLDQDQAQLAQTLLGLARLTYDLHRTDLTLELISQIKEIYQTNNRLEDLEPHYWQLYANVLDHSGDLEAALEAQKRALDYSLKKKQDLNSSTHHFYLANLYIAKKDWPSAKFHYLESYLISKRLDDIIGMAAGATSLARLYRKNNLEVDNQEALEWSRVALPLQQLLGDRSAVTGIQIQLGQLSLLDRRVEQAKKQYQEISQSNESIDPHNVKNFLKFGAELATMEGNFKLANELNVKLLETVETQSSKLANNRLTSLRSLLAYSENERNLQAKKNREFELAQRAQSDRLQFAVAVLGCTLIGGFSVAAFYFRRSSRRYKELAESDALTAAHSRRYLFEAGEKILKTELRRSSCTTTALLLDVDHFKRVNDQWGHLVGDQVLKHCVTQIRQIIRSSDAIVARYGGEEFCVLIPKIDKLTAHTIAERIRLQMTTNPYVTEQVNIPFTVSIGVAQPNPPTETTTLTQLIKLADERLYRAKNLGRNCVVFEDELEIA
jgi:diguanylate cyclase (GGDEF)-like protein